MQDECRDGVKERFNSRDSSCVHKRVARLTKAEAEVPAPKSHSLGCTNKILVYGLNCGSLLTLVDEF
jgi:hypothetical protein